MKKKSSNPALKKLAETKLPTKYGTFLMLAYDSGFNDFPHVVLVSPKKTKGATPVRIHSECMTGDLFSSLKCDCGEQLNFALKYTAKHGGMVFYLRQEGRGIGIVNKMKAYQLQDEGHNTITANHALGFETDLREYGIVTQILNELNISKVALLTNNPIKIKAFENSNIELVDRIAISMNANETNASYLQIKKDQLGHLLTNL